MKMSEKLTAKMVAERMNGREYLNELSAEEEKELAACSLTVVFGYSDDNVEFRGNICDEVGCYERGTIPILDGCVFSPPCGDDCENYDCELLRSAYRRSEKVYAKFTNEGWKFETDFPHEKFTIMEDGEVFGEGIVFSMGDLKYENA